jgi:carbamoyltransferase
MEFGQRALGARSILADPRRADMKHRLNAAVKYREGFRPFAPAILREHTRDWFATGADDSAPYMEKVFSFRPDKRPLVPAVVHEDGTGRLQTVDRRLHPHLHEVITAFHARTGVPLVLNTSFNLNGEPIVCTPSDAIRTFMTSGMDALYLGRQLLTKSA